MGQGGEALAEKAAGALALPPTSLGDEATTAPAADARKHGFAVASRAAK